MISFVFSGSFFFPCPMPSDLVVCVCTCVYVAHEENPFYSQAGRLELY